MAEAQAEREIQREIPLAWPRRPIGSGVSRSRSRLRAARSEYSDGHRYSSTDVPWGLTGAPVALAFSMRERPKNYPRLVPHEGPRMEACHGA